MKLRNLLVAASMLFTLTAVHAEDTKPGPAMGHGEMREEMKQRCAANPEKCAEMKERMKKEHGKSGRLAQRSRHAARKYARRIEKSCVQRTPSSAQR